MKYSIFKTVIILSAFVCTTTALTACSAPPTEPLSSNQHDSQITVSGEAFYRERIMLAPGSTFIVTLSDASSSVIAKSSRVLARGEMPVVFTLSTSPKQINPTMAYTIRAKILGADGQMEWITETDYRLNSRALTQDLGKVLLVKAGNDVTASPGMGPNPDMAGSTAFNDTDLLDQTFRIDDISGSGVIDNSTLTVRLGSDGQMTGSGGCNTYFASYSRTGTALELGPIGATLRACTPELMRQEQSLMRVLNDVQFIERDPQGAIVLKTSGGRMLRGFAATKK